MTWDEWSDWFCTLYGVADAKRPTVAAWVREVFVPGGRTPQELQEAARDVIRSGPPAFLNEILAALHKAVERIEAERILARREQEYQGGARLEIQECPCCGGVGLANVPARPQPRHAHATGVLQLCYVACKCAAGRRVAQACRNGKGEAIMTLERYEREWPDWLELRTRYEAEQAAQGEAKVGTKSMAEATERFLEKAKRKVQR